jgi:hypothetical protein
MAGRFHPVACHETAEEHYERYRTEADACRPASDTFQLHDRALLNRFLPAGIPTVPVFQLRNAGTYPPPAAETSASSTSIPAVARSCTQSA